MGLFRSFIQGGFEGSTHRRQDGVQLDVIRGCRHDEHAATDYRILRGAGIGTVRDALRWHRIETAPGRYDWSSFRPMVAAARDADMQVVWDLCHYGLPHDIDIWAPEFVERFAAFAGAAAWTVRQETDAVPFWCPVNEISFWAWAGGDWDGLFPYGQGQGDQLKRQLVRASLAAMEAVRRVDPRARFVQAEPLIHIAAQPSRPEDEEAVEAYRQAQFQVCDMLSGALEPQLGGRADCLDVVGLNFYYNNQWVHEVDTIGVGHRQFRPLHQMLAEVHARYNRPLMISETGAEGVNGPGWLHYIGGEVRMAMRQGVPVEGICIYPVMDYPGWNDDRHCPCGVIHTDADYGARHVDHEMVVAIQEEAALFRAMQLSSPGVGVAAE